jgi:SPX domain protein involved in polyphosphate accumulation
MDNLYDLRYERKFLIEHLDKQEVKTLIKMNSAKFSPVFIARKINNIYLDTLDLSSYYDNIEGNNFRKKIRIRWYGKLFGKIEKPVLEYKLKNGLMGRKKSYVLNEFYLDENTTNAELKQLILSSNLPMDIKNEVVSLQPTLMNSYKRSYFLSFNNICRLTLDYNLKYYRVLLTGNNFFHIEKENNILVVELKYKEKDDSIARDVGANLPFKLTKSSKYIMGLEKVYL